jgi:hypothetical protein
MYSRLRKFNVGKIAVLLLLFVVMGSSYGSNRCGKGRNADEY